MGSGHRTVAVFATVIAGLLLLIVSLLQGWPYWVWPLSVVVLATGAYVLARATTPVEEPLGREFTSEPDVPCPPPERREQQVSEVALPSAADDYDFRFAATVRWCPADTPGDAVPVSPAGLAVNAVLERARAITASEPPHRSSLVRHKLNGELAVMRPDGSGRVLAMAEEVTLSLFESDAVRLRKLSTVRKDEQLWAHERRYERDRREYLGEDVLKDTGSAVVWWLAKNDDRIEKAVEDIGALAQLSSAANNRDIPEQFEHMVPYPIPAPELDPAADGYAPNGISTWSFTDSSRTDGAGAGDGTTTARAPADHFAGLLRSMGVPEEADDAAWLARCFSRAAGHLGWNEAVTGIRRRFDFSSGCAENTGDAPEDDDEESTAVDTPPARADDRGPAPVRDG